MRNLCTSLTVAAFLSTLAPAWAQMPQPRVISGTITAVNGNIVTIQRSTGNVVVNDQPALNNQMTGNVAVGRQVVARGYWRDGTFYATSFADANVYGMVPGPAMGSTGIGRLRGEVRGTITAVNGHLVTLSNGTNSIVINTTPALRRKLTGNVANGRDVVATGFWRGGTFYATTIEDASNASYVRGVEDFGAFTRTRDSLSGTITAVSGNQVTLQQANGSVVVNDQPALNNRASGNVAVGRAVIADGYWLHGTFYVQNFSDATP